MSEPYRDPQTEQAIADARARPLRDHHHSDEADMARNAEGPFDDKPDAMGEAMKELDHAIARSLDDYPRSKQPTPGLDIPPRTVLTGESHDAFAEFTAAAHALEAHQRAATPVLERYKSALGKLSAIAARSAP